MKNFLWRSIKFIACGLLVLLKTMLFIVVREVTLRKQAEERTNELAQREAQRRMNEFLNIASHELKTPLTSIKGNIQLMGRRLASSVEKQGATATPAPTAQSTLTELGETTGQSNVPVKTRDVREANNILVEIRELLERTDKQVSHLTRLVNALLETSRLDNNMLHLRLEPVEMNKLVREIAHDTHYVPEKRLVHVEEAEENFMVFADSQRIRQVVIHYLSNAHKFSLLEEKIDVMLEREANSVRVSVHDSGPGISPNEHNKIWERFYRVPAIEVRNGSEVGLGLGLYLSRIVVEKHNGKVGLESTPGEGSTFWFVLPLAADEPSDS